MKKVLAFDFGASSGRAVLGIYKNGHLALEEVHRFSNYPLVKEGRLFWDIHYLFQEVLIGIKKALKDHVIDSIGVDTWGVDFGLIDKGGDLLTLPRSYRDSYTQGVLQEIEEITDLKHLYKQTGNQLMEINTLFQLYKLKQEDPEIFNQVKKILFMPDLINYLLTGELFAERSIASTSQMLNPETNEWATEILEELKIPIRILPTLADAGHVVGYTKPELKIGNIKVIHTCEHDTASAVVSVPSNQKFLFISCGTWSLVGTELTTPVITEKAFDYNLTNELGFGRRTRFLKNLTGLWILQELRRNLSCEGKNYTFEELTQLAEDARAFTCWIDTDHALFSAPGSMKERIIQYAEYTHQTPPKTEGEFVRCVYESLAMKYKLTFMEISEAIEGDFDIINIVGGGSQAAILCQFVSDACNIRVEAGPVEATAMGNIAVQLFSENEFSSIEEVRQCVKENTQTKYYFPEKNYKNWDREFSTYQNIIKTEGVDCLVKTHS
ncbi:rhamnulokinase [Enterococcus sp. AZ194]|uniref:rhamnulokinase n=1 Tax=Enterococcus sp. AZ194 TaxID=2774629 RepID=UPI003F2820A2